MILPVVELRRRQLRNLNPCICQLSIYFNRYSKQATTASVKYFIGKEEKSRFLGSSTMRRDRCAEKQSLISFQILVSSKTHNRTSTSEWGRYFASFRFVPYSGGSGRSVTPSYLPLSSFSAPPFYKYVTRYKIQTTGI